MSPRPRLTVLSIAYPFARVGEQACGGAEQVLGELDRALVAAGHTSLVVACEGSAPAGKLFPAPLPKKFEAADRRWCAAQFQIAINRALSSHPVDLIHMHGLDFHQYRLPSGMPVLVTLHMPLAWYPPETWLRAGPNVHFQCVSESQRRTCPPTLRDVAMVENGVALTGPGEGPTPRGQEPARPTARASRKTDFALVLGRICPEKNQHAAFEAGTLARVRVLLGGEVFAYGEHQAYFEREIASRLKGRKSPRHEFLGPLTPERRAKLLASARCLLHPTLAPETSSLVAMEALAAGTPVIAYRSGALPSIVEEGVTGFLVDTPAEMAFALGRVGSLSREACRAAAAERFSRDRMLAGYFHLYDRLLDRVHTRVLERRPSRSPKPTDVCYA